MERLHAGIGALGFWYHLQFLRPWVYPFLFLGLSLLSSEKEEGIREMTAKGPS